MLEQISASAFEQPKIDWKNRPKRFLNPGELEALVGLLRSVKPRNVLEFGVNVGRTAQAILEFCPTVEHYEGIDVPIGYVPSKAVQRDEIPTEPGKLVAGDPRFKLFLRPRGSLDLTADDLSPCDAVWIDGDHSRAVVENDTALALSLIRPGGIICWHDYHNLGTVDVREVLHDFAAAGAPIFHVAGTWIAFQRF